jgi:hypothetical protein
VGNLWAHPVMFKFSAKTITACRWRTPNLGNTVSRPFFAKRQRSHPCAEYQHRPDLCRCNVAANELIDVFWRLQEVLPRCPQFRAPFVRLEDYSPPAASFRRCLADEMVVGVATTCDSFLVPGPDAAGGPGRDYGHDSARQPHRFTPLRSVRSQPASLAPGVRYIDVPEAFRALCLQRACSQGFMAHRCALIPRMFPESWVFSVAVTVARALAVIALSHAENAGRTAENRGRALD